MVSDVQERRCQQVIETLPMPRPFDLERFRLGLAAERGRMLRFVPAPGRDMIGLWMATADTDHIFYPRDATPLAQLHVIAREIGHMVLEHQGAPAATSEMARLLLPSLSLDPGLVVSTLGRAGYAAADEQEAELFAGLLLDNMEVDAAAPKARLALPHRAQPARPAEDSGSLRSRPRPF
jgi:hypothetical protein